MGLAVYSPSRQQVLRQPGDLSMQGPPALDPRGVPGLQAYYDAWELQRLGGTYLEGIAEWPDLGPNGWHAVQATGSLQPRFLPWSGQNYLHLPGVANNGFSRTAPTFTSDDTDIVFGLALTAYPPATTQTVCSIYGGVGQRRFWLIVRTNGTIDLQFTTDGTNLVGGTASNAALTGSANDIRYARVTRVASTGAINYFTGPGVNGPWTQLGTTITGATGAMAASTSNLVVGNINTLGSSSLYRFITLRVRDGIDGPIVSEVNAADGNANSATVADRISGTWTINTSGANPARIVSAPDTLLDGTQQFWSLPAGALGMLRNVPGATMLATRNPSVVSTTRALFFLSRAGAFTQSRFQAGLGSAGTYLVGGRTLDTDSLVFINQGAITLNQSVVQSARIKYSEALAVSIANGALLGAEQAFQAPSNTSDTDSLRIRLGADLAEIPGSCFAGSISNLAVYNRGVPDAQVRAVSRFLAARANAGIVSA